MGIEIIFQAFKKLSVEWESSVSQWAVPAHGTVSTKMHRVRWEHIETTQIGLFSVARPRNLR